MNVQAFKLWCVQVFRHGVAKDGGKSTLRNGTTYIEDKNALDK